MRTANNAARAPSHSSALFVFQAVLNQPCIIWDMLLRDPVLARAQSLLTSSFNESKSDTVSIVIICVSASAIATGNAD
jgi:hypothetical protein